MKLKGRHYLSGRIVEVTLQGALIESVEPVESARPAGPARPADGETDTWLAPALFDSQVNGFGGRDLNAAETSPDDVAAVMRLLWEAGVARFCPTVTTHSFERMAASLRAIHQACETDPQVAHAAVCTHVEGPYISSEDGPRGAHPRDHARPPDWDEFLRLQEAAGGRIGYVTLAPELPGAAAFIERLVTEGPRLTRDGRARRIDGIRDPSRIPWSHGRDHQACPRD